jgi:hypothetical protein
MCNDPRDTELNRRAFMAAGAVAAATTLTATSAQAQGSDKAEPYAPPEDPALPNTDFSLERGRAALLVIDPLVDFLDPSGVAWPVVKDNVQQLNTVENLERLFKAAHEAGMPVLVSPHYYFPYDHEWEFSGPLEAWMHGVGMFYQRVRRPTRMGFPKRAKSESLWQTEVCHGETHSPSRGF